MAQTVSSRTKTGDMVIVDADVHVHDAPAALAPYCAAPWRNSLDELARTPSRYLDIPGFAPSLKLDPPIPGGHPGRAVHTATEMREGLAALGIDIGILFPTTCCSSPRSRISNTPRSYPTPTTAG